MLRSVNLAAVDLTMNFASIINFIALLLLLQAVIKNRNTLRGFSVSGSFLTFVSICGFEVAFYLMDNMVSFILGLATVAFWLVAFIYSLRQKLRKPKDSAISV